MYGTLRSGYENPFARKLRAESRFIGPATVTGSIFYIRHYPGYRPEPAAQVQGELYRLNSPEKTLAALDEYEGDEYERVEIDVAGRPAWIYRYRTQPPDSARIRSGDFYCP